VLFGGWQTEQQLGFVAAIHAGGQTDVRINTENRNGRDIQTELHDRIEQIIEHSQTHQATNQRDTDHESHDPARHEPMQDHQPELHQAPEPQQDHQQHHDHDLSLGIE
jgi:hypothetical protein